MKKCKAQKTLAVTVKAAKPPMLHSPLRVKDSRKALKDYSVVMKKKKIAKKAWCYGEFYIKTEKLNVKIPQNETQEVKIF